MQYPIADLLDKISITELKVERIGEQTCKDELAFLVAAIPEYNFPRAEEFIGKLKEINRRIWDLESDIRSCKEEELGLEEVGRRAIKIRKTNKLRVALKNEIIDIAKQGFKDIKMNHGSE